jgi:two-component system phosphate regulon sensor histidine kinase PhoR
LDSLSEGVLTLDGDGKVLLVNPALAALLNRPPAEAVGKALWESLRHREVGEMVDRLMAGGEAESREMSFDGDRERHFIVRGSRLPDAGPARVVIGFSDITHVRRLENMRKEFVANVSHELKTPLTALRAALETLLDGALADPAHARDFLQTAQEEAERLQNLIEDLLVLSRLERPGAREESAACSLHEAARRVRAALEPLAAKAGVTTAIELPETSLRLAASSEEITQILTNLLDNAIKFNRSGGRVTLRARTDGARAVIDVEDTGPGISPEDQPRIFERFFRADKSRSGERPGTGLGLSIVKHIVENRQGSVHVESVPGQGSTFRVSLPLAKTK